MKPTAPPILTVIVPTRSADLISHHLMSHALYTPRDGTVAFVIVNTAKVEDGGGAGGEIDRDTRDFSGASGPAVLVDQMFKPGGFYGQWCDRAARKANALGSRYLVFANDDTTVGPGWTTALLQDADTCRDFGGKPLGLLGALSNHVSGPQSVFDSTGRDIALRFFGEAMQDWRALPDKDRESAPRPGLDFPVPFGFPRIVTFFALCPTDAYFEAGGFDQELPAHQYSDDILSLRLLKKGYRNAVSRLFVHHAGSRTLQRTGTREQRRDLMEGQEYFERVYPDAAGVIGAELDALGYGQ